MLFIINKWLNNIKAQVENNFISLHLFFLKVSEVYLKQVRKFQ